MLRYIYIYIIILVVYEMHDCRVIYIIIDFCVERCSGESNGIL